MRGSVRPGDGEPQPAEMPPLELRSGLAARDSPRQKTSRRFFRVTVSPESSPDTKLRLVNLK